jgi:hypothetical protein
MKDHSKTSLEDSRPTESALHCVKFCLECLYDDKKLVIEDKIGERLTIEELIGALLKARDTIEEYEKHIEWCDAR